MTKKIIYLGHEIVHYRIPIFRIIANSYELVISTSKKEQLSKFESEPFKVIYIPNLKVGPFIIHRINLLRIVKDFDVIIGLQNLRCLDLLLLSFIPFRRFKVILWGIGVSASYTKQYDEDKSLDFLRFFFYRKADALIFYSSFPLSKYVTKGFDRKTLFVANNTVKVSDDSYSNTNHSNNILMFVGSLYKEKGIFELLIAYKEALKIVGNGIYNLHIIGDGNEMEKVVKFIRENALEEKIVVEGAVFDESRLKYFYSKCILSISPNQAGLSVLSSMGHGVCFVTKVNAITGGELFNIVNSKTGILFRTTEELTDIIIDSFNRPEIYRKIGENAKLFYKKHRKPLNMANEIIDALNYVNS